MASNEILQIVVFSVFVGTAVAAHRRQRARPCSTLVEQVATIMLKVTGYVMLTAPLAIFAALAATVADAGPRRARATYAKFVRRLLPVAGDPVGAADRASASLIVGPRVAEACSAAIREPALLAFSTASSEAAYPRTLEELQTFGVSRKVASFVLPLGYSFNLDGSMMYCTFATLFIAQVYGIEMSLGQQITMLAAPDGHLEGHGRRAARLAGGDRRHPRPTSTFPRPACC